ncbi:hypothetical protein [Saccharopolyspora gregorii]|uniref:hypothetical protein n=1 Tax=Saccharopolyspora gregorii TaxID=33914 RepID=UPI0031E6219D
MKFDMGSSTLSTLTKQTQGSSDDLGTLIRQLIAAAEPLEGKFNGAGRAAFDGFQGARRRDHRRAERIPQRDPRRAVRHGHLLRAGRHRDG